MKDFKKCKQIILCSEYFCNEECPYCQAMQVLGVPENNTDIKTPATKDEFEGTRL